MPNRRIVILTTIPETLEGFFVPQINHLDRAGFEVCLVSSPGPALDRLGVGPGVKRFGVPMERQPHPRRDLVSLMRLCRLLIRLRPDVVHAHTPKAGLLGLAAAAIARVPVRLYTVHGLPLETRTGLSRRILEAAEKMSVRLATRTYCVSPSVRKTMAELNLSRTAVVLGAGSCGGVDTTRFQPAPELRGANRERWKLPSSAVVVTFVGRLSRDKGIAVLAQAWPEVVRQEPRAVLVLAGEPDLSDPVPPSALESLKNQPSVHWLGSVPKADIPGLFAATDVAVLPTFREGLPQVALEAGAAGVPMVSCRVTGAVDAIADGVSGVLVPAGDAAALAQALTSLVLDPPGRAAMGRAARAHIVARFDDGVVNELWMNEYLRLTDTNLKAENLTADPTLT